MIKSKAAALCNKIKLFLDNQKNQKILLCIEILLCIIVFITLSFGKGVDWDESFTHGLVTYNDVWGIIEGTAADVHPPLYYLIVKAFVSIFGNKLAVYTWVSITAGIACMILSSTLIYKQFGFWTSGIMNVAFAFAPTILSYNLNIRMYSWTLFFSVGCLLFAREVMEKGTFFQWSMLFLFSICGVYTQYFAVFPIVAAYACILLYFVVHKTWKKFIPFGIVCLLDILCYIPWLLYASHQFAMQAAQQSYIDDFCYWPADFFEFASYANIENTYIMEMILFFAAFALFLVIRKSFSKENQWFIGMLFACCVFSFYGSQTLAIFGNHFYTWRYIYPTVGVIWMIYCIIFTKMGTKVYFPFCIWTLILCMSSYTYMHSWEYDTTPLLEKTMAFTDANISPDSLIVHDYGNFDTLYRYYLPGHEFIHFDELDLSQMKGETFWFIQLGGSYFTDDMINKYGLEIEKYSGFGYMGMVKFELEKVTVTK